MNRNILRIILVLSTMFGAMRWATRESGSSGRSELVSEATNAERPSPVGGTHPFATG